MAKGSLTLSAEQQANIDKMIAGVGALNIYFNKVVGMGSQMDQALKGYEETREEMLAEEIK